MLAGFRWYSWCEKSGCFEADTKSSKPPFVIVSELPRLCSWVCIDFKIRINWFSHALQVLPPPNVIVPLHVGHGLTAAIEVASEINS